MPCCQQNTSHPLNLGKPAPGFRAEALMPSGEFGYVDLNDLKGKWVVLFFYPLDFTFVCPTEIKEHSRRHDEFEKLGAVVLGGSIDSVHSHKAWSKELGSLKYPLFSDLTRKMSKNYGALLPEEGFATRASFIIDNDGNLRYALYHDPAVGRSVDETLRVLTALQTGELCPVDWESGKETLGKA